MAKRSPAFFLLLALAGAGGVSCGGADASPRSPVASAIVDVPGVDTHDFTARERHEFSDYVTELPAPCSTVAVPLGQCVIEKRPCAACTPASVAIAKAVREGMTREQVRSLYKARFDPASAHAIPLEGSPSRGVDDAPVVIVEFADFECPFCQKIAPELDELWEKRKDRVRFVYKFLPLAMHAHGEAAARAAIAAQMQGKFWEMHHKLFANGQHLEENDLTSYARAIGLDLDRFHADMAGAPATTRIEADRKLSETLGVKGTPTLFIDGREYDAKADIGDWVDGEIAAVTAR